MQGIPDYISPLVAYRTWQWDELGLVSLNGAVWPTGEALAANANLCTSKPRIMLSMATGRRRKGKSRQVPKANWLQQILVEVEEVRPEEHIAPAEDCSCGIYAAKNLQHLEHIGYMGDDHDYGIHGEIYLWGKIWDHSLGYRAQYAYPKNLTISFRRLPWSATEVERRLALLAKYGVDMFLQPKKGEKLLLWSKETGFNPRAFEPIIDDRAKWYAFREKEHRMEPGDLLAVLGLGIGIIRAVDMAKAEVHVMMFNRQLHKIGAQHIRFDKQNCRWESASQGSVNFLSAAKGL
jgi:hypothetical protein